MESLDVKDIWSKDWENVHIYPSAKIYLPWNLSIGDNSCIGEWSLIYNLGHISILEIPLHSHKKYIYVQEHMTIGINYYP